jgi:hypothetical protein
MSGAGRFTVTWAEARAAGAASVRRLSKPQSGSFWPSTVEIVDDDGMRMVGAMVNKVRVIGWQVRMIVW